MFGPSNERAILQSKELEAEILASRPEDDRVKSPAARLSRRAWLAIALACAAIVTAVVVVILF